MKKSDITYQEVKMLLKREGITVRPTYKHDDYLFTSFTMPWPLKNKLDRIGKRFELSRSKVVQLLIDGCDEMDFLNWIDHD
jgi:hypothetical protein